MRGQKPEERGSSSLLTDHSLPSPSMQRPEEYSALQAIILALQRPPLKRLRKTWGQVSR